jgi:hypothetical protein
MFMTCNQPNFICTATMYLQFLQSIWELLYYYFAAFGKSIHREISIPEKKIFIFYNIYEIQIRWQQLSSCTRVCRAIWLLKRIKTTGIQLVSNMMFIWGFIKNSKSGQY